MAEFRRSYLTCRCALRRELRQQVKRTSRMDSRLRANDGLIAPCQAKKAVGSFDVVRERFIRHSKFCLEQIDEPGPGGNAQADQERLQAETDQGEDVHILVFLACTFPAEPEPRRYKNQQGKSET
jgi:hypothetical protein